MKKIQENLQTIIDAINYAENEESCNYVITKTDKDLLNEALDLVKLLAIPDVMSSSYLVEFCKPKNRTDCIYWKNGYNCLGDTCKYFSHRIYRKTSNQL